MKQSEFQDFLLLVADTRAAQKAYFAERTQSALRASRILERKLDKEVERLTQGMEKIEQSTFWGKPL